MWGRWGCALLLVLAGLVAAHDTQAADPAGKGPAAFPLAVSGDGSHLVDRDGLPFLVNGDTAWSLIAELTLEQAEVYLQDRKARGFNALLVNLIEHEFSTNAPANAEGVAPFELPGRFDMPDPAYFAHAHAVLQRARDLGFLVFLAPAYVGVNGGSQGWWQEMTEAGPERLAGYAGYLARTFGDLDNIVWTHGGDWDVPDKTLVTAMAEAIDAAQPGALQTVHSNRDTVTAAFWRGAPWLDLDTAYTYGDTGDKVEEHLAGGFGLPVVLIESRYENERDATPRSLRKAAYGAIMAGAAGQVFGNNPIWHFTRQGLFAAPRDWREELSSPGSVSMTHLREFFEAIPWWTLRSDAETALCGAPNVLAEVDCAAAPDGRLAVVYSPRVQPLHLAPAPLAKVPFCAHWVDPRSGTSQTAMPPALPGPQGFDLPPPETADDDEDWLLLLLACEDDPFAKG
ncbi:DUF4038 domain-containing protein (plasmid) [Salipiger sp. H15]|uniref:DUF4038 domain-containing protein n=1 Tax=Alloyangia sp. H15 TaxID=3029062 RepID=A0AAU8ASM9_9RHOB